MDWVLVLSAMREEAEILRHFPGAIDPDADEWGASAF
jgi:hypothetical protein